jgi:hypothetical protein
MTTTAPRLPARPSPIQPWLIGLGGVVLILVLLVVLTI